MTAPAVSFRTPAWQSAIALLATGLALAFALSLHASPLRLRTLLLVDMFVVVLCVLSAVCLSNRVELSGDTLRIRRQGRASAYPRSAVKRTSWEAGAPVAVEIAGDAWVILPRVGPDPQTLMRAVDAWIPR